MKKIITLMLVLALALSLVFALSSCGETVNTDTGTSTETEAEQATDKGTESSTDTESETEVESDSDTDTESETEVESDSNTDTETETDDPEHVHTEEIIPAVEPTCEETGLTEGKKCSECGEILVEQETIDASGHTEEAIAGVEPTCTETGLTEGEKCSECGEILVEQETVDALGHTYENSYTCKACGYVSAIESTGLEFTLNTETDTYTVTGIGTCTDTNVVIPYKYENKMVTSIKDEAFYDYNRLESINIPSSVTSIGFRAFWACNDLTNASYMGTIEEWCNMELDGIDANPLHYAENRYINGKRITELVIPNTVTKVKAYTFFFSGKNGLTSVTIPESVTSIGNDAFGNAHYGNTSLNDLIYLGTIEQWCNIEFGNEYSNPMCYAENLYIGEELISDLVIPKTLTETKSYAFCGNLHLKNIIYLGTIEEWCNIVFNSNPLSIAENLYISGELITELIIPDTVKEIKDSAFADGHFTNITIPNSVKSIGERAFSGCISLTSITIPNSVTSIGDGAFEDCTSLTSITIGESVTSIGAYAFSGCTNLTEINFNARAMDDLSYNNYVFDNAGKNGDGIKVTIGKEVTKIPAYLFCPYSGYNPSFPWTKITNVEFEEGSACESIGNSVFENCKELTNINIPESVSSMGESAFYNCRSLTSITIPESVTSIGEYTFRLCSNLTSIVIPNSVTSIGHGAFYECDRLTIYCEATSQPSGWDSNWNYSNRPVYWYSEEEPTQAGNYWHYVDGVVTVWE